MAAATDSQVQKFSDERFRPFAELLRSAYLKAKDHQASIGDVYAALTAPSPTWTDARTDGPPTLLTPNDLLAWNAFMVAFTQFVEGNGNWPAVLKACVRQVQG